MQDYTRREFIQRASVGGALLSVAGSGLHGKVGARDPRPTSKPIPSSGERIPVIGLGTGSSFSRAAATTVHDELASTLIRFTELGGALIDTAPNYGRAEPVLGTLLRRHELRNRIFLATKVAEVTGRPAGLRQARESAQHGHPGPLDLLQVHNLIDWRTQLDLLLELKADGVTRYVGVTTYRDEQYPEIETILNGHRVDFIQLDYAINNRGAEKRLLPLAADRGVAVIANMPFGAGRLFTTVRGRGVPEWLVDYGADTWAQFFLRWIVSHPAVTATIPATADPAHVEDNVRAAYQPLPDGLAREEMEERFKEWTRA